MVVISCKPKDERQELTFKPEIELKELATWVMGFTCKNFVLLTPQEAYRAFLVALSTMGLAIVPKAPCSASTRSARNATHSTPRRS
jgi:hypothetical protein